MPKLFQPDNIDPNNVGVLSGATLEKPIIGDYTSATAGTHADGKMYYDTNYKTMVAEIGGDSSLQIGQEDHILVLNTGASIANGKVVYLSGISAGLPTIALARSDSFATSFTLGVTTQTIGTGETGLVTRRGEIHNIDTSGAPYLEVWAAGDVLYLSDITAGGLTNNVPVTGSIEARMGRVLEADPSTGEILVDMLRATRITDLADVTIAAPAVDQILKWNGTEWVNGSGAGNVSAGPGVEFFNCTPAIVPRSVPAGISQDGTSGNGIWIASLSKTPVTSLSSTVTVSIASPGVITWPSHGLPYQAPIIFTTTGALPTGISPGLTYYVQGPTGYTANSFRLSAFPGGADINTTGTQSGVHTATVVALTQAGSASTDTRAFSAWLYDAALERTTIDAGLWDFTTFAGVSSISSGRITTLTRQIYQVVPVSGGSVTTTDLGANTKTATITSGQFAGAYFATSSTNTTASYLQTPSGIYQILSKTDANTAVIVVPTGYANESGVTFNIWNKLFGVTSARITSTSVAQYDQSVAEPAFTISSTDKLGQIGFVTSNNSTTVTVAYNGTSQNTHFSTPLVTLHNNLAGLNQGSYRHAPAAVADNDFLAGQASDGNWLKKTLAETQAILGVNSTPIEAKDTGYTITWAELTSIPKTFTCDSASNRTFDFAVPVAGDVGKSFRVVKTGTDAGNITIDAPSTIYIEDSTDGGTVTGEAAARCSITLQLVTATKLAVISATGTWVTA